MAVYEIPNLRDALLCILPVRCNRFRESLLPRCEKLDEPDGAVPLTGELLI
jgi:hypothetical protein